MSLAAGLAAPSRAQVLVWERVGGQPYNVSLPSIAPDGTMWSTGYEGTLRLDPPYGPTQPWVSIGNIHNGDPILTLGQDTLVTTDNLGPRRSVDNGATFQPAPINVSMGIDTLDEIPVGLPHGGTLLAGAITSEMGAYSRNRGASWTRAFMPGHEDDALTIEAFAVVRTGPRAGRVVGTGFGGLVTSDDGGATYAPVPGWWQYFRYYASHVAVLTGVAPGGGDRLLALVNDPQHVPYAECLLVASDDGGDTWREIGELLGDTNARGETVVDFGGGRVVVVMNGGQVWESTDGGGTWVIVGVVPGSFLDEPVGNGRTDWALKGPDGRLYVGGRRLGGSSPGWAFRTVTPFVAGEAGPSAASSVRVAVRPNPASGRVAVSVSLAGAGTVRVAVFDAQGREVAVAFDGALAAGEREVPVETGGWPAGVYIVRVTAAGGGGGAAGEASARFTVAR